MYGSATRMYVLSCMLSECQYILLGRLVTVGTKCSQNCSLPLQCIGLTPHIGSGQEVVVGCSPQVGRSYFDREVDDEVRGSVVEGHPPPLKISLYVLYMYFNR